LPDNFFYDRIQKLTILIERPCHIQILANSRNVIAWYFNSDNLILQNNFTILQIYETMLVIF